MDISNNRLIELPSEIGNLSGLTHLYIHSNRLTQLPSEIEKLHNLLCLDISDNRLTHLPSEIGNLNNLRYLDIRNNPLISPENLYIRNNQHIPQRFEIRILNALIRMGYTLFSYLFTGKSD